uniref:HAT C-terminal dimerisation domain-containing protein n=1 Tax=Trichogramma kaykai TaxID=54128 RepID=A0ABD2WI39_9HYME
MHPELVQFYKLARLDRDEDPIKFWEKKIEAFRNLAPLAVKYVAGLATSVPLECLFSQVGLQKSKIRNRLNPETLNMIVFLHSSRRCKAEVKYSNESRIRTILLKITLNPLNPGDLSIVTHRQCVIELPDSPYIDAFECSIYSSEMPPSKTILAQNNTYKHIRINPWNFCEKKFSTFATLLPHQGESTSCARL